MQSCPLEVRKRTGVILNRRQFLAAIGAASLVPTEFLNEREFKEVTWRHPPTVWIGPILEVGRPPWSTLPESKRHEFYTALVALDPEFARTSAVHRMADGGFAVKLWHLARVPEWGGQANRYPRVHLRAYCPVLIDRYGVGADIGGLNDACRAVKSSPLTPDLVRMFDEFTAPTDNFALAY